MPDGTHPQHDDYHCTRCTHLVLGDAWPKICPHCGQKDHGHPEPTVLLIMPYREGILGVRRTDVPGLSMPGGRINRGEPWKKAGARIVESQLGIHLHQNAIEEFAFRDVPEANALLLFGAAPRISEELPSFVPNAEASERVVLRGGEKLAYPSLEEMFALFLSRRPRR